MDRRWKKRINGLLPIILGFSMAAKCPGADQETKNRLDAAIAALKDKINRVHNERDLKNNLQRLQEDLQVIRIAINTESLDAETVNKYLRRKLQQSAFSQGQGFRSYQKSDVGAPAPMTPFKLQEGVSSEDIIRQQWNQNPIRIPVHHSVLTSRDLGRHPPLAHYAKPQGYDISNDAHCLEFFQASFGAQVPFEAKGLNPYTFESRNFQPTDQQKCNIIRALAYAQPNFSQHITIRKLQPGEVLTRCVQRHTIEPGSWWTKIQDMPTSVKAVREGTAVLPHWNQSGKLEFFVVPEGCDLVVLEGLAAAQCLREYTVRDPQTSQEKQCRFFQNGKDVTGHYLEGGTNQIFITDNINGAAFDQHLLKCVTILETGFEVEMSIAPRY
jgi:hypothetical protein